jgi:D-3-phosphoglycerate dehydrogenase
LSVSEEPMPSSRSPVPAGSTVVLTDHPWPDVEIERAVFDAAGYRLVAGPIETPAAAEVDALVAAHDPVAIMTCWAQVSAAAIAKPRNLHIVARMGVGLDNIVVPAATQRGAWVTNIPDYCVEEVSDHAVALLLDAWRGVTRFDRAAKLGEWNPSSARLRRVRNMTVGVLGYGRIGAATVRKLSRGFGCRVFVYTPSLLNSGGGREIQPGVFAMDIATIQQEADAIVLHLPLTPLTQHLVSDDFLRRCVRRPLLVNVSRGPLIDNAALIRALDAGLLSGAALDVVEGEPAPPAAVIARPDVIITPHVAFSSDASLTDLRQRSSEDVVRVLHGKPPLNPCNAPEFRLP